MKTLILYYSYGGNTKRIAEMIQKEIGGDIAHIDTVVPYDGDYDSRKSLASLYGMQGIPAYV